MALSSHSVGVRIAASASIALLAWAAPVSAHVGLGLDLVSPSAALAACAGPGYFTGTTGYISYLGSTQSTISTDSPSTCSSSFPNSYWTMVLQAGVSGCGGEAPYAQAGWFSQIGRSGPLPFLESNGVTQDCDTGPIFFNTPSNVVSGSNTYRISVHGQLINDNICFSPRADFYLNGSLYTSACLGWSWGNVYEIFAERTGQDNYVSTAAGVYFSSNEYCGGSAGADCTPNQALTVSSADQGGNTPNSPYKRLSTDPTSFVVCDSRATPNPCS